MSRFQITRTVAAPPEVVWPVVSDVAGYAEVAPNLSRVEIVKGARESLERRCFDLKGRGWNERCELWDEGRAYAMEVDTAAPDYPYPFRALRGTWRVVPQGAGSRIEMQFDFQLKYGPVGRLMAYLMRPAFKRLCGQLMDNWEALIRERSGARALAD